MVAGTLYREAVLQDFRLGLRQLTRRATWSLSVVFVLALRIGANAAIFSGFEAWVLRTLDFPEPERLVQLEEVQPRLGRDGIAVSPQNYGDWRERQVSFESMGALRRHRYNLADEGEPVRLDGARISASLFPLLGKTPIVGRAFTDEDDRPASTGASTRSSVSWSRASASPSGRRCGRRSGSTSTRVSAPIDGSAST